MIFIESDSVKSESFINFFSKTLKFHWNRWPLWHACYIWIKSVCACVCECVYAFCPFISIKFILTISRKRSLFNSSQIPWLLWSCYFVHVSGIFGSLKIKTILLVLLIFSSIFFFVNKRKYLKLRRKKKKENIKQFWYQNQYYRISKLLEIANFIRIPWFSSRWFIFFVLLLSIEVIKITSKIILTLVTNISFRLLLLEHIL